MSDPRPLPELTGQIAGTRYTGRVVEVKRTRVVVEFKTITMQRKKGSTPRRRAMPADAFILDDASADALSVHVCGQTLRALADESGPTYRPTIRPDDAAHILLANAYDFHQAKKGDSRRAYRGQDHVPNPVRAALLDGLMRSANGQPWTPEIVPARAGGR